MRPEANISESAAAESFVTVMTGGQLFGLPLARVRDVFVPQGLSLVPLAPPEIVGLLNLRGRIVTAIDLRRRLGLPPRGDGDTPIAINIEARGELYGLIVDRVGEVLKLDCTTFEANPVDLDRRFAGVMAGVHRLAHEPMVVLDLDTLLDLGRRDMAA